MYIYIYLFINNRSPQKTENHSGCNSLVLEALQKRAKILQSDNNDDDW